MNIVHIIPGTGGSFYCENCVRDGSLVSALRKLGHDVTMVPLYLPLSFDQDEIIEDTPIFFGAISTYVIEKFPGLAKLPAWITRILDSRPMLKFAAHQADSTRAAGLEDMTLSMLKGKAGNQGVEIEHLVQWLKDELKPDVIYLANLLLLGLAESLREGLDVPLVCAMEDEDIWLDDMESEALKKIWSVIADNSVHIDAFLPVSDYYNNKIQNHLDIPAEKLKTVHVGIDTDGYPTEINFTHSKRIGYLSRLSEVLGLGILVDAFLLLKAEPDFTDLKLSLTGGDTSDDKAFIHMIKAKLTRAGVIEDVEFQDHFDKESRIQFLQSCTVLSVPMLKEEAFGVFLLEALAAGVPIIQPHQGAFPEIVQLTGGGLTYSPNTPEELANTLRAVLLDEAQLTTLAQTGHEKAHSYFSSEEMAKRMIEVYRDVAKT